MGLLFIAQEIRFLNFACLFDDLRQTKLYFNQMLSSRPDHHDSPINTEVGESELQPLLPDHDMQRQQLQQHSSSRVTSSTTSSTLYHNLTDHTAQYEHIYPDLSDIPTALQCDPHPSLHTCMSYSSATIPVFHASGAELGEYMIASGREEDDDHHCHLMMRSRRRRVTKEAHETLPAFAMHRLQPGDTLERLALLYGIHADDIRMANGMLAELEFFPARELLIPNPLMLPGENAVETSLDPGRLEEQRHQWSLRFFSKIKKCPEEIAKYYLLLHDFDISAATREYDADVRWERQQQEKLESRERKRKILAFKRCIQTVPLLSWAMRVMATCIPFERGPEDPIDTLEEVHLVASTGR